MAQQPKNHHYLPEFYLSAWCRPKLLQMYTKRRGRIWVKSQTTGQVGYRKDLYRLNSDSIEDKGQLESHHFQSTDNRAAPIIRKLIENPCASLQWIERFHLARFILSLPPRSPWGVEKVREIVRATHEAFFSDPGDGKVIGLPEGQTILDDMKRNPHYLRDAGTIKVVQTYVRRENVEPLLAFNWKVLDTSGLPLELVVSDNPLMVDGHLLKPEIRTRFRLPLSPTRLLEMSNFDQGNRPASMRLVREINQHQAQAAEEHFFAATRTYDLLARRRLREHPDHRLSDQSLESRVKALLEKTIRERG